MTSKMKRTNPHKQKDYLGKWHKTAVRMVEDMVTDPTEPHMKTVKTREAEVRKVLSRQSREFCSFAYRGGKHKVQRVENYIKVEFNDAVKHVVAEDMPWPLSLAMENVTMHSNDSNDVEMLVITVL
jgi:hypothetical protein